MVHYFLYIINYGILLDESLQIGNSFMCSTKVSIQIVFYRCRKIQNIKYIPTTCSILSIHFSESVFRAAILDL